MNKIVFDAQIVGLRATDYEFLQNSIESYVNKAYRQLLKNPNTSAIIQGFDLKVDSLDNTKLMVDVSATTGLSGLITQDSTIIETSTGISSITLSNDAFGTVNYVYAHYYTTKGSYDIYSDSIIEDTKLTIDLSDYSLDYNRQLDKIEIVVMTAAEYAEITSTGNYVYLGSTVAQGSGQPLLSADTTGVTYTIISLPPSQIEVSNLSPSFLLPQPMVDNSDNIDDDFYGTPIDVEDDLNRIRTEIKDMKGTPTWEDFVEGNLLSIDPTPDRLHLSGTSDSYGNNFETIIFTSSGYYARISSGKAVIKGNVITIYEGDYRYLALPELTVYNYGYTNPPEGHYPIYSGDDFTLNAFTTGGIIDATSIKIYDSQGNLYSYGSDYIYTANTGTIHMYSDSYLHDGYVYAYYKYGYKQYQSIDITSTGEFIIQEGNYSYPPYPAEMKELRLYNLLRDPFIAPITADLTSAKTYLHNVREVTDIFTENYSLVPYVVNKVTYYTDSNEIDESLSQWTITSTGTTYVETSTVNSYFLSKIFCREDDELYIRITKPSSNDSYNFTVSYEAIPGSDTFTDVSFTNIQNNDISSNNVLIFVFKGLSEGYHKIKVVNQTTSGTLRIYGITYGKLDSYYTKDAVFFTNNIISQGSLVTQNITIPSTSTSDWIIKYNSTYNSIDIEYNSVNYLRLNTSSLNVTNLNISGTFSVSGSLSVGGELTLGGTNNFKFGTSNWVMKYNNTYDSIDFNYSSANKFRLTSTTLNIGDSNLIITSSNITAKGEIRSIYTSVAQFRAVSANYGFMIRNDNNNINLLLTNSGDANGSWNSLRPLIINNATGFVTMENGLSINSIAISGTTWTIVGSSGNLDFKSSGVTKARLATNGDLYVVGEFKEVTSI